MKSRTLGVSIVLLCGTLAAAYTDYASCAHKFQLIESDRLRPGARVDLTARELNAWVAAEVPPGVRDPRLAITAPGTATGTAMVDFGRLRRAQGHPPGWLLSKLLAGEHPVSVTARIQSDAGRATVNVQRVEVSGMSIEGSTLDFLIRNFLLPLYPNAAVDRPFELGHKIRKLDVQPRAVSVYIGR